MKSTGKTTSENRDLRRARPLLTAVRCCVAWLASGAAICAAQAPQYDVVVYGGTSAAVTAAIEAARMGKSVVIVSPDQHLGGMTASGLGWTDIGNRDAIGGLSREFYQRVYDHYLPASAWTTQTRQNYISRSSLDPDATRQMMFTFEPKVARQIFVDMLAEANVPVITGRLDRTTGVTMAGGRIASIRTLGGTTVTGRAFVDATYEGDLMAAAGVSYVVGREPNGQYGETLNGIQTLRATKNQLPGGISGYVVPGDPTSGLLPGVNATAGGVDGAGDQTVQAYNFRMVLTNHPANRRPVPQPAGYDEADFELLFRAIEVGQTGGFFKLDPMPNNKTDSNNTGGISTDFIGGSYSLSTNWNYAEGDYQSRDEAIAAHRYYQMGLVWTLQNHPRVPQSIRNSWDDWGLPLDEFTDTDNWPDQLYVREARRMVGDLVLHQRHVNQAPGFTLPDSVGMGGYNMDSHNTQRHLDANGFVRNEGDIQVAPSAGPYPISYRALTPRAGEAENLIVPVAVSATHIAYGSIRMEPVFMALGQAAGAAAALTGEYGVAARELPYALLRSRLIRGEGVLGVTYTAPNAGLLLNFGATVANDANSPGHAMGGIPSTQWNLITGDRSSGLVDSQGAGAAITVDLGKSAPDQQVLDWEATGFSTIALGSALTTGLYAGNVRSALLVNDGANSRVDVGVRVGGLAEGTYDVFVTAKNTNTATDERYRVYSLVVDAGAGDTDYNGAPALDMVHGLDAVWRHGESVVADTFQVIGQQDLVIVVEGVTTGELRGFLNTLEIVKLAGIISADVNRDGSVDLGDFSVIRQHFLANVALGANGDANSDGIVDHKDFYFWRRAYVAEGGDPSLAQWNVPEPAPAAYVLALAPIWSHLYGAGRGRTRATGWSLAAPLMVSATSARSSLVVVPPRENQE